MRISVFSLLLLPFLCFPLSANAGAKIKSSDCIKNNVDICVAKADRLYNLKSYKKALPIYKKSCGSGNLKSCVALGDLYHNGQGARKNVIIAAKLYEKACNNGESLGCEALNNLDHDTPMQ